MQLEEIEQTILDGHTVGKSLKILGIGKGTYEREFTREQRKQLSNLSRNVMRGRVECAWEYKEPDNFIYNAY